MWRAVAAAQETGLLIDWERYVFGVSWKESMWMLYIVNLLNTVHVWAKVYKKQYKALIKYVNLSAKYGV